MFGKKNKKDTKIEKVFDSSSEAENAENNEVQSSEDVKNMSDEEKLILGVDTQDENELTEAQKEKLEDLSNVKDKLSRLLKSSNIEIVDENFGDEYEAGTSSGGEGKQQQDYDSLKDLYGTGDANKKKELTLTIDDYDYTYTGQYLDEFDVSHLKIKRIRLQNKYAKKIKKIALIASICLVVIGGAVAAFLLTREKPVYLKSISLNQESGKYFINDYFDYAGLYILAEYSDGRIERIKLDSSHLKDKVGNISQDGDDLKFTGTQPASLTFTYGGQSVDYSVVVTTKEPSGLAAVYSSGLFNLNAGDKISKDNLKLLIKYANFNPTFYDYNGDNTVIEIMGNRCSYDSASGAFIASESTKPDVAGELSSAVIRIVYGGFELQITDVAGQSFVETAVSE
ncbi:MAG: hypothetical protein IJA23_00255 [Clostridia bacterium]|nr:hypothetical protein [Clostridia bacterium]